MPEGASERRDAGAIEAVLFDLGDTLVKFEISQARRFLDAAAKPAHDRLREWGLSPPPYARYRRRIWRRFIMAFLWSRLIGRELRMVHIVERVHAGMGVHLDDLHIANLMRECTPSIRGFFATDEESLPLIRQLHAAGLKLGLVSNTFFPGFAIDDVLLHEDLLEYFPVRVYSSEVRYMKPNRRIFEIALERVGVRAERAVYVGDRPDKDVKGAGRVGMTTVLMAGHYPIRPWSKRPDHVIQRLAELPAILGLG